MISQEIIKLQKIYKYYPIGTEVVKALRNINLTILRNEYVAIMGPSGSGKSTLMNLLGCLDTPSYGQYFLNNKDVSRMSDNELAKVRNKEIGFVFQTFNLMPRYNALENVILPLVYAGKNKSERNTLGINVLNSVGLSDRMKHKPNELSGGQRQRVAIARAMVNNPTIILADEPTGNLDSITSFELMRLIDDIHKKGNTIILVTHEEEIAHFAHRIIRLKDGRVESDLQNTKHVNFKVGYENLY
ncbi:MAG: macrolide ABC transporter ATP-binding protein [Bacteroidetes bacterium CG23_combo_of_CG06-09_8_20_14_all_32_9]|nr:MAG: macrolide ABC transporter ATP-binding protein [Bacteroidetes bacterium CG23_combo_of_CG06-09_8_20_14_all_32_9]